MKKKILLISKDWNEKYKSGLGTATILHKKIFEELGYQIVTASSSCSKQNYNLNIKGLFNLLVNFRSLKQKIILILNNEKPDIIVVESLQTAISELFILVGKKKNYKLCLISHGISIFPYSKKIKYFLRFLIWLPYLFSLKYILKKIDIFFTLDETSKSKRHLDTQVFKTTKNSSNLFEYNNICKFENEQIHDEKNFCNEKYVLNVGYVNHIKNQFDILKLAKFFKKKDIKFIIVYNHTNKKYFKSLINFKIKYNLDNIKIIKCCETKLKELYKNCWIYLNTSITEVMPLSIIESCYFKKIYISYDKGSIKKIGSGIVVKNFEHLHHVFNFLFNNEKQKQKIEQNFSFEYQKKFSYKKLVKKLEILNLY